MKTKDNIWSPAEDAEMIRLWNRGWSAGRIATHSILENRSRNAIIARLFRLRKKTNLIQERVTSVRYVTKKRKPRQRPEAQSLKQEEGPLRGRQHKLVSQAIDGLENVTPDLGVNDLKAHHCKYPYGDPKLPGFHFCGAQRELGRPYCATHCAIAFQRLPQPKRQRFYKTRRAVA